MSCRPFSIFIKSFSVVVLIMFSTLFAQDKPDTVASIAGIQIETSVDKAQVYIGDLVNYTITVTYDSSIELLPPPLGANLGAFDVKDYQTDIATNLPNGRLKSESHFVLSTFTTGDYIIPPVPMAFVMSDGSRKVVLSESVPIKVNSLLLNTDDSVDIRPLKAQYEFPRDYTKYYVWGSIIFLVLATLGVYIWLKLRHKIMGPQIDLRPAWEIAFEKLAKLDQKGLVGESQFKQYYIEITEILRVYLGRMYAANITDMTTDELFENYDSIGIKDEVRPALKEFLNHADLVKFAKYVPNKDRCQIDFRYVHDLIEFVRKEFQQKAELEANIQKVSSSGNRPRDLKGVVS